MNAAANTDTIIDNELALEILSDDLILNYDPLVEHFKSRQEAFKRNSLFYTFIDYTHDYKTCIAVKETKDNRVFLVKTRLAAKPDKDGGPQVEEYMITEFEKECLTDNALIEKAKKYGAAQLTFEKANKLNRALTRPLVRG